MEDKPISHRQLRRIQTLWGLVWKRSGDAGASGESRKMRLAWIGLKIGRPIDSCKELTRAEAKTAIDAMQKLLPPDLVRRPSPDRETAKAYGTAGRQGDRAKTIQ